MCLWLKLGSIISFSLLLLFLFLGGRGGGIYVTYFPYISWVIDQLLSGFIQLHTCTFFLYVFFPFFPPHHPSSQISLYSQNCLVGEKKASPHSMELLHKSRKYKYTFLPHWPVWHFPYLATSLSHLITIRANNNTTEPVRDTYSHTRAHNTMQHWPAALFHWTNMYREL